MLAAATAALLIAAGAPGGAVAEPVIGAELNTLATVDGNCRMTIVMTNGLDTAVDKLTLETVLFDADGTVIRFLLLAARPLPARRMRVQQFDVDRLACEEIGRVLLNDVTACAGTGLDPQRCLGLVVPSSRARVSFDAGVPAADQD